MKLRAFMSDTMQPAKGAMKVSTKGIIEGYRERYDALIKRPEAKFQVQTYKVSPNHQIMVHVKVPSETVNKLHYDVLLALSPEKGAMDLLDCDVKIFSNCPSFVYSVAYIFAHWDPDAKPGTTTKGTGMMIDTLKGKLPRDRMLIPGTEKKLGKQPVHDPPVVRNPLGLPLFDKSIYYAIFYLQDNVPYDQIIHTRNNVSMARVVASVEDFERLMSYRRKLEQEQKRQKALQQKSTDKDSRTIEWNLDKQNRAGMMLSPKQPTKPKTAQRVYTTAKTPSRPASMKTTANTRRKK